MRARTAAPRAGRCGDREVTARSHARQRDPGDRRERSSAAATARSTSSTGRLRTSSSRPCSGSWCSRGFGDGQPCFRTPWRGSDHSDTTVERKILREVERRGQHAAVRRDQDAAARADHGKQVEQRRAPAQVDDDSAARTRLSPHSRTAASARCGSRETAQRDPARRTPASPSRNRSIARSPSSRARRSRSRRRLPAAGDRRERSTRGSQRSDGQTPAAARRATAWDPDPRTPWRTRDSAMPACAAAAIGSIGAPRCRPGTTWRSSTSASANISASSARVNTTMRLSGIVRADPREQRHEAKRDVAESAIPAEHVVVGAAMPRGAQRALERRCRGPGPPGRGSTS